MSEKDIVEEARALLTKCAPKDKITNGADAYLFDMQGPRLLRALADEVERLRGEVAVHRGLNAIGDEGARLFAEGESEELNSIYECDKCDLCEDHHD